MKNDTIKCPECSTEIKLTEAILAQISGSYDKKIMELNKKLINAEKKASIREEDTKAQIEEAIFEKEKELRLEIKEKLEKKQSAKIDDLKEQMEEKEKAIEDIRKQEIELRKKVRVAEDKEKNLELEVQRRLDEAISKGREEGQQKTLEEFSKKDKEREMLISNLRKELTQMKQKVEQGSQQSQGEVLELEIEELLMDLFPRDNILPVPKGHNGADVDHSIVSSTGKVCGKILWETKRTKRWNNGWIDKLKGDILEASASIGVIISDVLPDENEVISNVNGVWVTKPSLAKGLALILRQGVLDVGRMKSINKNQDEKANVLYDYLTSVSFRNRVEKLIESFVSMKSDLDKEKRAVTRLWKAREKQLDLVIETTSCLVGDIQGVVGVNELPIAQLDFPVDEAN